MSTSPGPKKSPGPAPGPSPAAASSPAKAGAAAGTTTTVSAAPNEEDLRRQLRSLMQKLKEREPLDPTYRRLLMNGVVTRRKPQLPKTKTFAFYKRIGSQLRQRVETFCVEKIQGSSRDPWTDRISQRQALEEDKMRAAFNLREFKEHEQQPLLAATLAALPRRHGMDEMTRRRYLDGVALGLTVPKKMRRTDVSAAAAAAAARFGGGTTAAEQTEQARQAADHKRLKEQTKAREAARRQREEEERQRRELENKTAGRSSKVDTPQQALYKVYYPIFKILWDMEFPYLGGTNPFRIVINRENCASVGAPDYFDVIDEPMNLTYIQQKVENMKYKDLASFFADVELLIRNALTYNSDPSNPYRKASEELQKKYKRLQKKVILRLQQQKQQQQQQAAAHAK